jgi:hypothetical protein
MKKIVLTCTLVLAVVSFMALTPAVTAAKTVKLTYSNFFPSDPYPEQAGGVLVQRSWHAY